jgi:hypothetical protein
MELSRRTRELHRALASLIEELEAVDWYQQRVDISGDGELKSILIHNRNEEIEHAAMALEWLRRNVPEFDSQLRTYLFTEKPITDVEEGEDGGGNQPAETAGPGAGLGIGKFEKETQ